MPGEDSSAALEFIELLNSHGVEYLVVGGHALAFHGYPRYTGEIDFLVRPAEANASRIVAVLESFGLADAEQLRAVLIQEQKMSRLVALQCAVPRVASVAEPVESRLVEQVSNRCQMGSSFQLGGNL